MFIELTNAYDRQKFLVNPDQISMVKNCIDEDFPSGKVRIFVIGEIFSIPIEETYEEVELKLFNSAK